MTDFNRPSFENTYRLEPRENERFYPSKVKTIVEDIVYKHLKDMEYDHAGVKTLSEKIVSEVRSAIKNQLNIPNYKIAIQTVIGQLQG